MGCVIYTHIGAESYWSYLKRHFFQKVMAVRGKEDLVLEQNCVIFAFSDAWSTVWHSCSCHRDGLSIPWTTGL